MLVSDRQLTFRQIIMTPDQLFDELRSATSLEKRQQLVEAGLKSGISLSEVSDMLDFLEASANEKDRATINLNAVPRKRTGVIAAFLQALFCSLRLR